MKILILGDIHGRKAWELYIEQEQPDKIIFLGDYVDSFDIKGGDQLENLKNIIEYKKLNQNKVILLLGNHDYHYLKGISRYERYSGFQENMYHSFQQLFDENLKLFQICHVEDKFLFVHAGITKTWLENTGFKLEDLTNHFIQNPKPFGFTPGRYSDPYGNEPCQSPIWVRPESLAWDMIEGYTQVVGHTTQLNGVKIGYMKKDIILNDALEVSQYLIIENNNPKIGKWINPTTNL